MESNYFPRTKLRNLLNNLKINIMPLKIVGLVLVISALGWIFWMTKVWLTKHNDKNKKE